MKNTKFSYILMSAHFCSDINQGALPAILPFLIITQDLNYTLAATLLFASNLVSSLTQPILGYFGDKSSKPWLMSLGVFLCGFGMSFVGVFSNYFMIMLCVCISGFGAALFHPEGGKLANYVAGTKKGAGISIFGVGGNLGFAIGPLMASFSIYLFGLSGTLIFLIPAIFMPLVLNRFNKDFVKFTIVRNKVVKQSQYKDDWKAFTKVSSIVFLRSIIQFSLLIFIPLFFMAVFFFSETKASFNLTIFALIGAIATLFGGKFADMYGTNKTIIFSAFALVLVFFIFLQTKIALLAVILIIPIGFFMNSSYSSLIVLSQSFVPNHVGFASGITLGLSVSMGGLFAPIIGYIADVKGLIFAMYIVLGIMVLAAVLTLFIPDIKRAD